MKKILYSLSLLFFLTGNTCAPYTLQSVIAAGWLCAQGVSMVGDMLNDSEELSIKNLLATGCVTLAVYTVPSIIAPGVTQAFMSKHRSGPAGLVTGTLVFAAALGVRYFIIPHC